MGAMLGKSKIEVDTTTLADGDSLAAYLTSAAGTLLTHTTSGAKQALDVYPVSTFAEDAAHTTGDLGQFVLAVRKDAEGALAGTDGDYAPLQVDALGRLRVNADINVANDFVYAEDAAAASGDLGASVLLVRQDTLSSSTSTDGDYGHFKSNAAGELYIADTTARTTLASLLAELQSITFTEDAAHTTGDAGIMSLAVRNDTPGTLAGADGDYAPLQVDSSGNLRVIGSFTIAGQFAEDAAHTTGDTGLHTLSVRKDAQGSNVSADGDYASNQQWSEGSLKVVDIANGSMLQQQVSVEDTATALPTTALSNRKVLMLQNVSSDPIWIGTATVTTTGATTGIRVDKNSFMELEVGPAVTVYGIAGTGNSCNTNVLEMA